MRIHVAIAHYFKPASGFYGSARANPAARIVALTRVLESLHVNFGRRQGLLNPAARLLDDTNHQMGATLKVTICTTKGEHLIADLPGHLFTEHATDAEPMLLGYECHDVLRQSLGKFDYYCYLEDDIEVVDPWFFRKLDWFSAKASNKALLQPNRFERTHLDRVHKLYIDCNLRKPELSAKFQDMSVRPQIKASMLGAPLMFQRINNPHAGCFFLNAVQMEAWSKQPYFMDRSADFGGPLESAATLGIMRCFNIYKPSRENADFLEVTHLHHRYIGRYLEFEDVAPFRFKILKPKDS
ncbi:MAG: hypothetical protein SGJ07_14040 [Rhodospirillaceae bacterium]|nr:hypothetical protein [Rhodospirillaceae bacterium]